MSYRVLIHFLFAQPLWSQDLSKGPGWLPGIYKPYQEQPEGKSSKEIGELLFISPRTVEHHRANMMTKLKLRKTADLVRYASSKGYV